MFEGPVELLRRNPLALAPYLAFSALLVLIAPLPLVPVPGLIGSVLAGSLPLLSGLTAVFLTVLSGGLFLWGVGLASASLAISPLPRQVPSVLCVDEAGLWLAGELAVPRALLRHAYVQPDAAGDIVRVRARRRASLAIRAGDRAGDVVDALGLGAADRTIVIVGRSVGRGVWYLALIASIPLCGFSLLVHPLGPVMFLTLALALWVLKAIPSRIEVGADGVLRSWLVYRRFTPFASVAGVEQTQNGEVRLRRTQGRDVLLSARTLSGQGAENQAVVRRIDDALRAFRERAVSDELTALLTVGERDLRTWLREIRALCATRGSGYRGAGMWEERLLQVLRDPSQSTAARAGAAVALAQANRDQCREELRVAAEACAEPRVRVVLERLSSSSDDEQWEQALQDVVGAKVV